MAEITNTSGRRKTAVARIYLKEGNGSFTINGKDYTNYFPTMVLQYKVNQPFKITGTEGKYEFKANLDGGGITGQAGAIRHGITRALMEFDESLRPTLRKAGFVTRDARQVERKKVGLHKARKRPQYSKR